MRCLGVKAHTQTDSGIAQCIVRHVRLGSLPLQEEGKIDGCASENKKPFAQI